MLQHFGAEDGIEAGLRKRNLVRRTGKVHSAAVRVEITGADLGEMGEIPAIGLFSAADVQHFALHLVSEQSNAALDQMGCDEPWIRGVGKRLRLEWAECVEPTHSYHERSLDYSGLS